MRAQEVTQIDDVPPATTCIKTKNANVNNFPAKNHEAKHKIITNNKSSTQIHI